MNNIAGNKSNLRTQEFGFSRSNDQIAKNTTTKKWLLRLVVCSALLVGFISYSFAQTNRYWVTGGDGNWNSTSNWSTASGGASGASVPNANTFRAIFDANSGNPTARINLASFALQQFWITGNQDVTLISSGGARTITIGDVTNNSITGASVTNADMVVESGSTLNITGETAPRTMTIIQNNNANSQGVIIGTVQVNANGFFTKAANSPLTFNAGATYIHNRDAGTIPNIATWNATANCSIVGTTTTAPTAGLNQTFGNLTFNCASLTGARVATLTGNTVVQGDFNITGTSAANTITLQLADRNFTVNGTTNINAYGILNDNTAAGTNTYNGITNINLDGTITENVAAINIFVGKVTVDGTWNMPQNTTFRGGITVNSTNFTSGGTYTFNTNDQTIDGTSPITLANVALGTVGKTLTNANSNANGLTITGTLSGAGNFTNGTATNSSFLFLKNTASTPITITGTLDFTTNPNTVDYNGSGNQTVVLTGYYNLSASISGIKTLPNADITVAGDLTVSSATLAFNATAARSLTVSGNLVGNAASTIAMGALGHTLNLAGASNTLNTLTATGSSTVNYNRVGDQTVFGSANYRNLTISGGSTKTLIGNATIAGVLNLNTGILECDAFNLTISNNAAAAITGTFSSSNMIATNGTGYLIKNALSSQQLYPIGSGGYYSPMTLTAIAPTTGTLSVRAVPTALNPSYIKKYWDISSIARTSATATFQYDPAEQNGALPSISYYNGTNWQNPPAVGAPSFGANSFTITGTNPFTGWWTMGYRTYYSYRTADWSDPTAWTSDPSGSLQIGNSIPNNNDNVVILPGRTISLSNDITPLNLNIHIEDGGILDQTTYRFTNTLNKLEGEGTLRLATTNFPTVTSNTLVNDGGGTVEYNNGANFTFPVVQTTYNNLTLNAAGITGTLLGNLTLNGNLYIKQGTFQINDNSATRRQLTIAGNVTVDNGASITVGTGNTVTGADTPTTVPNGGTAPFINYYDTETHRMVVYGDFTNSGTVRFTNQTAPAYNGFPNNGAATVYFMGTTNNTLTCDGQTDFYNLVLDKGADQTYSLTINPSNASYFRLFGANSAAQELTVPAPDPNPLLKKALWIRTGTLSLNGFSSIPSLAENNDFIIPSNGALILDNLNVFVQSSADNYQEVNAVYGTVGGSDVAYGITQGAGNALVVLGKLIINEGYLSTKESAGLLYSTASSSIITINGGEVDTKQLISFPLNGVVAYTQTGGVVNVRGRFQRTPAGYTGIADLLAAPVNTVRANTAPLNATIGAFSINNQSTFTLTGGTIRIYDVTGASGSGYEMLATDANTTVTGGSLELIPTAGSGAVDAADWSVESVGAIGNFSVNRASSTTTTSLRTYPLTALNNINIQSGVFNANNLNVTAGGNFTIENGTTYTPGTNTTTLNGISTQTFTVNLAAALSLHNFSITKASGTTVNFAGSQKTVNVNNNFSLTAATMNDNGNTINIRGAVYNSGIHTGTGKIALIGTATQAIDGNGIFQNLELNNTNAATAPVSLAANATVNGTLTFSNDKLFDIKTYNLKMNSTASFVGTGATRYVKTAGTLGDGGITRVYSSPAAFTFPVGTTSTRHAATAAYTPATLTLNGAPTAYGSITVYPVGYEHPATTANGRSLTYFWRVKSSGFTLGTATVTHSYTYDQTDVVTGGDVTENGYVAARYYGTSWTRGTANDVDDVTNNIIGEPGTGNFLENIALIDGDYTAGDDNATNPFGTPTIYYSRINAAAAGSGLWSNVNTWSTTSHTGAAAGTVPGINDIVIIGAKDSVYLNRDKTWPYDTPNVDPRSCASLMIESGSALDIGYNPNCSFGMVLSHTNGNGNFRFTTSSADQSTFVFPTGDFSDFNVNLGTTEIYSTNPGAGTTYWLPNGTASYGNLILSPLGGSNIIFPNNNLTIYGNLVTRGQNADSWFCPTWDGNYPTAPIARIAKTITINGNLDIQGGALIWYGNAAITQNVVVNGNVTVAPNSAIDVWSGATSQNLSIGGNLINNTVGTTAGGTTTPRQCDFTLLPVTFFGSTSASITNTVNSPLTIFETLIVNKGSSQATTLTINIGGTLTTPTNNWLTLQNGTLRYMRTEPSTDFTISTSSKFTIPETAGLYVDYTTTTAPTKKILIGNHNANANSNLYLNGKLTLIKGYVYIGQVASPTRSNDIEYTGGGASALDIRGGELIVRGQIRRLTTSTAGVLSYNQSGGNVTIYGQNSNPTRAKLEVLNTGSVFNMSGSSTLTIVQGGGTTFGDLYLRPTTSSVTGGTILFTQTPTGGTTVDAVQDYKLESNVALNNLTITGKTAGTARDATVNLMLSSLVLNGNLTLSNTRSFFNANNLNLSMKGNMVNNGAYTYGTNTTIFNGITQSITGTTVTNFNHLTVTSTSSLTATTNSFTVNGNLSVSNGSLILSDKKLTLLGNGTINGSYTDNNGTGGITLLGTTQQQIAGTGMFGKLELNNNAGAILLNDISLQNNLVLTLGVLKIKQFGLTLGQTSNILGSPWGLPNMITTDGVSSCVGLQKFFTAGATSFTYPLGITGKYTPAQLTITANSSVGYVSINPVNSSHPLATDPANVLKYYWKIESSGISNFVGTLLTNYSPSDVAGTESDYVAANLLLPGTYWSKATTGPATDRVDELIHQISFPIVATNNITGEYTAGIDAALPDEVATYRSNKDGVWTDGTIWDPVGSSPPCPAGGPSGVGVIVDHEVSITSNYASAYSTTINGKLKVISPTFGHNLGNVDGSGTLYLESGNLPAGNYDAVATCESDATIEFGGSGTYTLASTPYNEIPNMFFTGSGTRVLSNKDLTICHRLVIDGPTLDNSVSNRKLTILGTMERYNTGTFKAGSGANATVSFAGVTIQSVGGTLGDFSSANSFNNLEINNISGLSVGNGGTIQLSGNLLLTNGIINTSSTNRLYLNGPSLVIPSNGTSTSFVNGPLSKFLFSGTSFLYPIGKGTIKGHNFTVTSNSASNLFWTSEFYTPNSTANALTTPLLATNTEEYWKVSTTTTSNAKVKIGWDGSSDLTPAMTTNGITDMRVAEYNTGTSKWEELTSTTSGNAALGDVATTNNVSIPVAGKNYTTASVTTTKPLAALNPTGAVCGSAGIPVKFTSFNPITLPYSLDYTLDGVAQTTLAVNSLPYTLPTPAAGTYELTGFKYNGATISGVVSNTSVTAYATPTTANAGLDQAACGITTFTLAANSPVAPSTGLWSIISGTGGNIITPTSPTSDFIGGAGKSYILRWTISNGGCKSTDDVAIGFPVAPQRPSNFTAAPKTVCQNSNNVYTVPSVPATTYNWSYSGTGASIGGTPLTATPITGLTNSVTINFNSTATSGTISVTATNACGTSSARTVAITVLPLPDAAGTITGDTPICQGTNGVAFSVGAITNATGYTWSLPAGASIASGANTNSITVDFSASAVSGNITVMGTNACGNGVVSPNFAVVVNNPPTIALTNANPIVCAGITTASITYGVTTNSPNLYSIDFDAIAQGQGFRDTSNVTLSSPINFKVPAAPAAGTYNANLTVTNSTTGCVSQSYPITITVNASPIASWTSPLIHSVCALQTGTLFSVTNVAGCTYTWTVESGVGVINGSGNSVTVDWADNAAIFTGIVTNVDKKVSVVITNTITGCTKTLEQTITIHRLPETGPQYHVPNTFAQ